MAQRKLSRDAKFYCTKKEEPLQDFPEVYLPCAHQYYHAPVIARSLLGHSQYTDFLATPKGFRWNKHTGLREKRKWKTCKKKKCKEDETLMITDQRYINDFLSDIWNVLTPESIKMLHKILMDEYQMTSEEATRFLEEQRIRSIFSNKRATTRMNLSERHKWVTKFAKMASDKLANYLVTMLNARRTKRVKAIAQVLIRRFGNMTGEECSLEDPGNPFESVEVFLSDRLAIWLANVVLANELDPEICREEALDEEEELREKKKKEEEEKKKAEEEEEEVEDEDS